MNPRRFDSSAKGMCFLPREFQSPHENQGAEMFRNVVGIAVRDTRGLPAQEAALRIRAEPVDAALPLPAGIPVGVINVAVTVDRQIDPISRWCDLELAINIDIRPIVAQEKLNHVAVPKLEAVLAVIRWQPKVQFVIR